MLDRTKHMANDTDKSQRLHRGHVNEYLIPSVFNVIDVRLTI
jgi:hypothetical protein